RRPGRRGQDARRADRPIDARGPSRPASRAAGADSRRRRLPGAGNRGRDAQSRRARGLRNGRHSAPDREQPDRLHDGPRREPLDAGVLSEADAEALAREVETKLKEAHQRLKDSFAQAVASEGGIPYGTGAEVVTAVAADRLRELDGSLVSVPEGFTIHPKLKKQLDRRAEALEQGGIDWGQAESLAFASLLVEGIPIRL